MKLLITIIVMFVTFDVGAKTITSARYIDPVERYGHFALGSPHEYAALSVNTNSGERFDFVLPEDEVFEDLTPRLVQLATDQAPAILAIVSSRHRGARLALIELTRTGLSIAAQSQSIGTPMRWLNPVGVADLDGDGNAEIAAVITPHIGGNLKVYRQQGDALVEIAALGGFSNHVYRSTELGLSAPVSIDGQMRLLVPDFTRRQLRVIAMGGHGSNTLTEIGRCELDKPITGAISTVSAQQVAISDAHSDAKQIVNLADCVVR